MSRAPARSRSCWARAARRSSASAQRARAELERLLGRRVHLFLFVRVSEDWTEDRERYEAMRPRFRGLSKSCSWSDEGIVLAARRHGERALIVQLLTREHGRHAGLVRGGQGRAARVAYQIGNRLRRSPGGAARRASRHARGRAAARPRRALHRRSPRGLPASPPPPRWPRRRCPSASRIRAPIAGFSALLEPRSMPIDGWAALMSLGDGAAGRAGLRARSLALRRDRRDRRSRLCLAAIGPGGVGRRGRALPRQAAALPPFLLVAPSRTRPRRRTCSTGSRSPVFSSSGACCAAWARRCRRRGRDSLTCCGAWLLYLVD